MTIERFTQWCAVSHRHDMVPDPYGSWVRALDYEAVADRVSFLTSLCVRAVVEGWTEAQVMAALTEHR